MEYLIPRLPLFPPLPSAHRLSFYFNNSHSPCLKNGSISYRRRDLSRLFSSFIIVPCHSSQISLHSLSKAPAVPHYLSVSYDQSFSKSFLVLKMRELLLNAGISTIGYSGHSLRKGTAITVDRNGISKHDIKLLERWKSDAVDVYINEYQKSDHIQKILLLNSQLLSSTLH